MVGVDPAVGRQERDFWVRRVHPDDIAAQEERYLAFARGEAPTLEEIYRVRHESGHWAWVLARARGWIRMRRVDEMRLMGYVVDVTARHTEFDLLRKREERFRLSLSALRGLVYDRDLVDDKTLYARTEAGARLRRPAATSMGTGVDGHRASGRSRARGCGIRGQSRSRASNFELTYRVRHKDGRAAECAAAGHVHDRGGWQGHPLLRPGRRHHRGRAAAQPAAAAGQHHRAHERRRDAAGSPRADPVRQSGAGTPVPLRNRRAQGPRCLRAEFPHPGKFPAPGRRPCSTAPRTAGFP